MREFPRYRFRDPELLALALTHRSAAGRNNERLEFLGDALIGLLIADQLFRSHPAADEGQLTRARASLVNRATLADIARGFDLGSRLQLGEGEMKSGGWRRDSILANALEAVVGAIYLDGGIDPCREEVLAWYAERLGAIDPCVAVKDPKTELQEYLQSGHRPLPVYRTLSISGPPHDQAFTVACDVTGLGAPVIATARSRRAGEQQAARDALRALLELAREGE